ncbi:hypothetical protein [Limimaricola litoreus]|uniref:Uncharacterized protein n=1 Tax=Limimaricola litoreus TaxID=2955316 RepID=A0A9X2JN09_9RHOB|nr:hypothetical protein [Limimaricola litoreus]MCP1167728.1 hypothetical protein [Limimaricola litoreus]
MGITEDLADALARDAIAAAERLGDDEVISEVSEALGASSTTTQEAYLTAVRVRLAEQRARRLLDERLRRGASA